MRRFRIRRRRAAAALLLPFAALTTTTALAEAPAPGSSARIDASSASVAFGDRVTLRGSFPGASNAPIEIRHRARGADSWRTLSRARTGAGGAYKVRVSPRASGLWRAELVSQSAGDAAAATATAVDPDTDNESVSVRSRTRTGVSGRHGLVGERVEVHGKVTPAGSERRVVVRIGKAKETTTAGRNGKFSVRWRPGSTGSYPVRVRARSNRVATASRDRAGRVTAYRQAAASWYGPGLYGNAMACGGSLTPSTLGVAHKTMPCGTKVRLRYGKRTVKVPVVDRGGFAGNREFDLTSATKQRLGFGDVGTVWTSK
jgi:rare lipoprotein A